MSAARRHALAFLAIAFLGVTVRFWGITEAGPYLHDDAVFHAEGWWMSQWWDLAKDSAARKMAEARTGIDWKMHDEALKLWIYLGSPSLSSGIVRPFPSYQLTVPAQNRFRLEDADDLMQLAGRSASC